MVEIRADNPAGGQRVPKQAFLFLREVVSGWKKEERELLETKSLLRVGPYPPTQPRAGEVYVATQDIKQAQQSAIAKENFSQLLWCKTMLSAVGDGATEWPGVIAINWESAKDNLKQIYRKQYAAPSGSPSVNVREADAKIEKLCRALDGPDGKAIILQYGQNVLNGKEHPEDYYPGLSLRMLAINYQSFLEKKMQKMQKKEVLEPPVASVVELSAPVPVGSPSAAVVSPVMPAVSSDRFHCIATLPPYRKNFFKKLNVLLDRLRVPADKFDRAFRATFVRNVDRCLDKAFLGYMLPEEAKQTRYHGYKNDYEDDCPPELPVSVTRTLGNNISFGQLQNDKLQSIYEEIRAKIGIELDKEALKEAAKWDRIFGGSESLGEDLGCNFLQSAAEGNETFAQSAQRLKYHHLGYDIVLPSMRKQLTVALDATVKHFINRTGRRGLGRSGSDLIQCNKALEELQAEYDTAFLTPEEYRDYIEAGKPRSEQRVQEPANATKPVPVVPSVKTGTTSTTVTTPTIPAVPTAAAIVGPTPLQQAHPQSQLAQVTGSIDDSIPAHQLLRSALGLASIQSILSAELAQDHERLVLAYRQALDQGDIATLKSAVIATLKVSTTTLNEARAECHTQLLKAFGAYPAILALASTPEGFSTVNRAQQGIAQLSDLRTCNAEELLAKYTHFRDSLLASKKVAAIETKEEEPTSKTPPVPHERLCEAVGKFIREDNVLSHGGRFQFSSTLQIADHPRHCLNLYFSNMQGERVAEFTLPTYQPDIREAIRVKEVVENFVLSQQGFVEFHKPFTLHVFNPGWEDVLPGTTTRLDKMNGLWYIRFEYVDHENVTREMGFSLGIPQIDNMQQEAVRRSNFVLGYLAQQRALHLPVTKEEARNYLQGQLSCPPKTGPDLIS